MNLQLEGKNVLVTGGGRGIGRSIALAFAAEGANVLVNDTNLKGAEETAALVLKHGVRALPIVCDISSLTSVLEMSKITFANFDRLDVLVNNAAVRKTHTFFIETDPLDCDLEFKVAVFGTMNCCRAFLPSMIKNSFGKIINIGTDAARVGQERECNYSAAKGAILSFTKSLAKEIGRNNINVNAVSPGATNAPMRQERIELLKKEIGEVRVAEREEKIKKLYALRRIGEPEDVANTVVYLASEPARHITGQVISVNGGFAMVG